MQVCVWTACETVGKHRPLGELQIEVGIFRSKLKNSDGNWERMDKIVWKDFATVVDQRVFSDRGFQIEAGGARLMFGAPDRGWELKGEVG